MRHRARREAGDDAGAAGLVRRPEREIGRRQRDEDFRLWVGDRVAQPQHEKAERAAEADLAGDDDRRISAPPATGENWPVSTAWTARLKVTSAVASLARLSPSRMVSSRRGSLKRRRSEAGATESGGETMAPSTKPTPHESPSA